MDRASKPERLTPSTPTQKPAFPSRRPNGDNPSMAGPLNGTNWCNRAAKSNIERKKNILQGPMEQTTGCPKCVVTPAQGSPSRLISDRSQLEYDIGNGSLACSALPCFGCQTR